MLLPLFRATGAHWNSHAAPRLIALAAPVIFSVFAIGSPRACAAENPGIVNRTGVSKLDKNTAKEAARGLKRDMALALLAEHRAASPKVRQFATKLHDRREQSYAGLRLLAQETRLELPGEIDMYQRKQIDDLASATGKEFDKKFLHYIAETNYTKFYEFELNSGALRTTGPVKKFAQEQLAILRKDMAHARELLQATANASGSRP